MKKIKLAIVAISCVLMFSNNLHAIVYGFSLIEKRIITFGHKRDFDTYKRFKDTTIIEVFTDNLGVLRVQYPSLFTTSVQVFAPPPSPSSTPALLPFIPTPATSPSPSVATITQPLSPTPTISSSRPTIHEVHLRQLERAERCKRFNAVVWGKDKDGVDIVYLHDCIRLIVYPDGRTNSPFVMPKDWPSKKNEQNENKEKEEK